jgi:hypothetical protein
MNKSSTFAISPELWQAYLETNFIVFIEPKIILNVDNRNEPLAQFFNNHHINSAAFITAYNPRSELLAKEVNSNRQIQLTNEIERRSLKYFKGLGQHPSQKWQGEPSLLILDIALEAAKKLSRDYEQNAFVWCDQSCTPQLLKSFD